MKAWIIAENEDGGRISRQTRMLQDELAASPEITSFSVYAITDFTLSKDDRGTSLLLKDSPVSAWPDFVLVRGATVEKHPQWSSVLSILESHDVLCINSSSSIQLAADKLLTSQRLKDENIPVPDFSPVSNNESNLQALAQKLGGWPLVLKQVNGTFGLGVALAKNANEFSDIVGFFRQRDPHIPIMAQTFVSTSAGRDVRALVIGDQVVCSMLRQATDANEFRSNCALGAEATPFALTDEGKHLAIQTAKILGLDYAGVDLLFAPAGFQVCEANKAAGFLSMASIYPNVNIPRLLIKHCVAKTRAKLTL